jgi:hypothetical protein
MHLSKLPTIFVKNGEERKAYFTVQARELVEQGWVEKGTEPKKEAPKPEVKKPAAKEAPAKTVAKEEAKGE